MNIDDFLELRQMLTVVHHVPGRLRVKVDLGILKHPALPILKDLGKSVPLDTGLVSVRLNPFARSLILEYDPARISPKDLEEFLSTNDKERAKELVSSVADLLGIKLVWN